MACNRCGFEQHACDKIVASSIVEGVPCQLKRTSNATGKPHIYQVQWTPKLQILQFIHIMVINSNCSMKTIQEKSIHFTISATEQSLHENQSIPNSCTVHISISTGTPPSNEHLYPKRQKEKRSKKPSASKQNTSPQNYPFWERERELNI